MTDQGFISAQGCASISSGDGSKLSARRWLAEFGNAALKCERVGHRVRTAWRKGYVYPETGSFRSVADRVKQERVICDRCDAKMTEWETVERRPLNGFSASEDAWDEIRAGRGYWTNHGRSARLAAPLNEGEGT